MNDDFKYTMITGDVARAIGVSVRRVQQLDDVLRPVRGQAGARRYDPEVVQRYIATRAKAAR